MLSIPYVTTTAFAAHPTYLDLLNLRVGNPNMAAQTAELFNVLLMASRDVDNYLELGEPNGTLSAHSKVENARLTPDRYGRLYFHPSHIPILSISQVQYGVSVTNLTTITSPNLWIEEGREVVADLAAGTQFWSGSLQFGPPAVGCELFTSWSYVAGYPNTILSTAAIVGATSIVVADATGLTGGNINTPATSLRIWDPGSEETVTVASSYVSGSTTVPLTSPLVSNHDPATNGPLGVSALPAEVHLAVIMWATALLMRPNSKSMSQWRGGMKLATAGEDDAYGDAIGLIAAAKETLEPYRRVR